ncbi:MAG: DUF2065 domain-containing protein [Magnetococcales bacterium]|nr:DUF2065 domain-containing protein [Magnetococcales bacterium]
MDDFLTAVGLMLIFEGMPYFISPHTMRRWIEQISLLPEMALRRTGFALMLIGLSLVYWVRQ